MPAYGQPGTRAHTVPKFYLNGFIAAASGADRDPYVWVASVETGEIVRKSPKNLSIVRGLYDGPGGFAEPGITIEKHLAKIESDAAIAIKRLAKSIIGAGQVVEPSIWRFLAWQAARTPGWLNFLELWLADHPDPSAIQVVEPPPEGFETTRLRERPILLEDPHTGVKCEFTSSTDIDALRGQGWRLVLRRDDYLELMHCQAWYFQVRHFPRLSWTRLQPPEGQFFITSDRGISWLVDGYAGETPPAALRDPGVVVFAPLTSTIALIGRHWKDPLNVTPQDVNCCIAETASSWIAGPTREAVQQALDGIARIKGN